MITRLLGKETPFIVNIKIKTSVISEVLKSKEMTILENTYLSDMQHEIKHKIKTPVNTEVLKRRQPDLNW